MEFTGKAQSYFLDCLDAQPRDPFTYRAALIKAAVRVAQMRGHDTVTRDDVEAATLDADLASYQPSVTAESEPSAAEAVRTTRGFTMDWDNRALLPFLDALDARRGAIETWSENIQYAAEHIAAERGHTMVTLDDYEMAALEADRIAAEHAAPCAPSESAPFERFTCGIEYDAAPCSKMRRHGSARYLSRPFATEREGFEYAARRGARLTGQATIIRVTWRGGKWSRDNR